MAPEPPQDLGYKPENVAVIRKAMVGVTQEGTGARVFAGAGYLSGDELATLDEASLREPLSAYLARQGFRVSEAASAADARDLIRVKR